ncbi:MAG: hypothetical protein RL660_543 [Bacteroidota bacterium]|jgi:hypothetical protein
MNKRIYSVLTLLTAAVLYFSLSSSSGGYPNGSGGCSCHGAANSATTVSVSGFPSTYNAGQTYTLTLTVSNSTKVEAGFSLLVSGGTLGSAPVGTALNGTTEINHSTPQTMVSGTASWTFTWTAPTSGSVTLSVAGNAVNNNNGTGGDQWSTASLTSTLGSSPLSLTASATPILCNGGISTIVLQGAGGTPPYTYSNGGPFTSNTTYTVTAGTYTFTVKDATNASATTVISLTQPPALSITPNTSTTHVNCFGGSNGSASIVGSGGTPSYQYKLNTGAWQASSTFNTLTAGTYTIQIRDANLCTASTVVSITQPAAPVVASIQSSINTTCGACNASATATATGGTAGYTYSWSGGGGTSATAGNLCAGTYTCTVTDTKGCTATTTITFTQAPVLLATATGTNASCNNNNGTATVTATGGTGPYAYMWMPGMQTSSTISGLAAGTYTVTVTDANACTKTSTVVVAQSLVSASATVSSNVLCNGGNTGVYVVTASGGSGPYTYSNNTGPTYGNLSAGTYTTTVTDASGCTSTVTVTITQPSSGISLNVGNIIGTSCGQNNGSASVIASGGTAGYTYLWTPGNITTSTANNLAAGTYTIAVTDANGCTASSTVSISGGGAGLVATVSNVTHVSCFGGSNGSYLVATTGGTAPYSYSGSGQNPTTLQAGIYSSTVTDANGCTTVAVVTITQPTVLLVPFASGSNVCNQNDTGSLTASAMGGTPPYTYTYNGSSVNSNLPVGIYTIVAIDDNGCTASTTAVIQVVGNPPNAAFSVAGPLLTAQQVSATLYQWFKCNPNLTLIPGANASTYTALVSGDYGLIVGQGNCLDTSACQLVNLNSLIQLQDLGVQITNADNKISIVNTSTSTHNYTVVTSQGAIVAQGSAKQGVSTINTSALSKGIYYVRIANIAHKIFIE